jgi:AraC-like DNA-binding protein
MNQLGFASISAVQQYLRYAESVHLDTKAALAAGQISEDMLNQPQMRITGESFQSLIANLIEQSDDPLLGLHSGDYVQPGSYNVLGYITMSCSTLKEAIDKIIPYEKLVGDMGVTRIEKENELTLICWHCLYDNPVVRPHMIDNVLASWCNYARWLANQNVNPIEVRLPHPMPSQKRVQDYQKIFGCPIRFDALQACIAISDDYLAAPLRQPDTSLQQTLEAHASHQMAELHEPSGNRIVTQVKDAIDTLLRQGVSRKERVADYLGINVRTLQRRLQKESVSYQQLLDQVRLKKAKALLKQSQLSLNEIAEKLGFSETGSFHRSFKNWTGKTPGEFREND